MKYAMSGEPISDTLRAELDEALGEIVASRSPLPVASGRVALQLLLETSGLDRGAEILLPAYTFGLLYPAVRASGFAPVAVDIDPHTFQMDPARSADAVTGRTGAIVATHLFGEPCDIGAYAEIADSRGLLLIEDCAQALGALTEGKPVGSFGHAAITSFDVSKPLQCIKGGLVWGSDTQWLRRVRERLCELDGEPENILPDVLKALLEKLLLGSVLWRIPMTLFSYHWAQSLFVKLYRSRESGNKTPGEVTKIRSAAMPGGFAEILKSNLHNYRERLSARRQLRALYHESLGDIVAFQHTAAGDEGTCHMIVGRVPCDTFRLRRYLAARGTDIGIGAEIADDCSGDGNSVVSRVSREAVSFPVYHGLSCEDVERVCTIVRAGVEAVGERHGLRGHAGTATG